MFGMRLLVMRCQGDWLMDSALNWSWGSVSQIVCCSLKEIPLIRFDAGQVRCWMLICLNHGISWVWREGMDLEWKSCGCFVAIMWARQWIRRAWQSRRTMTVHVGSWFGITWLDRFPLMRAVLVCRRCCWTSRVCAESVVQEWLMHEIVLLVSMVVGTRSTFRWSGPHSAIIHLNGIDGISP